jgi:ABC-type Fe3+-hydroxamate transport system substrate-binding protein
MSYGSRFLVYFAEKWIMIVTDQLGHRVELKSQPKRIVSVVPSQTELLHYLGLREEVVGITKFCIHPEEWFRNKTRVGGTKQLHIQKIKDLAPDLIIANKEENVQGQIEELALHFPVWISDVNNLPDALKMIGLTGVLVGRKDAADALVQQLEEGFSRISAPAGPALKTCYLIWKDPYMTVGGDTFIHDMLSRAGFNNLFATASRYPEVALEYLKELGCELLLLSSEPYPFRQKHADELQALLPDTRIMLVDGELFSWYGSRLLYSPGYFQQLRIRIATIC